MWGFIIMGMLIALFLCAGITFLSGHGGFLIAGYNAASKEEKAKYNQKKLYRSMGVLCIAVSIMMTVLGYLCYRVESGLMQEMELLPYAIVFAALVAFMTVGEMIYSNTACKIKK